MFKSVASAGVKGIGGYVVKVETDISPGMPGIEMVGYLGSEVKEAASRVRTAMKNSGYSLPVARITVNLAPADIRKSGTGYDLPIALSILACMKEIPENGLHNTLVAGELQLSGNICGSKGILPMILEAKRRGYARCIIPSGNASEGSLVEGIEVIGVDDLKQAVDYLNGRESVKPYDNILEQLLKGQETGENDFSNIRGQPAARRGIEIAAAGMHNILMIGPPGAGKTMLAKCLSSILPPLSPRECLEISSIYSVKGLIDSDMRVIARRPFVAAHHTSTDIALIGGGNSILPGAVSMAHNGVLFLDELPEFSRRALEALRQPLEDRVVNITRNRDICTFPADFMLVATMNPCPCGFYPDRNKCNCTDSARNKYMSKISGPLMDRIDISVTTSRVSPMELGSNVKSESSENIRKRVMRAHSIQQTRFKERDIAFNSQMNSSDMEKFCVLDADAKEMLMKLSEKYEISARAYVRIIKIARTIADLEERERISKEHIMEAVRYKCSID